LRKYGSLILQEGVSATLSSYRPEKFNNILIDEVRRADEIAALKLKKREVSDLRKRAAEVIRPPPQPVQIDEFDYLINAIKNVKYKDLLPVAVQIMADREANGCPEILPSSST